MRPLLFQAAGTPASSAIRPRCIPLCSCWVGYILAFSKFQAPSIHSPGSIYLAPSNIDQSPPPKLYTASRIRASSHYRTLESSSLLWAAPDLTPGCFIHLTSRAALVLALSSCIHPGPSSGARQQTLLHPVASLSFLKSRSQLTAEDGHTGGEFSVRITSWRKTKFHA